MDQSTERGYGGCEGPDAMYVKLISSDGHEFIVKREHALTSGTIKGEIITFNVVDLIVKTICAFSCQLCSLDPVNSLRTRPTKLTLEKSRKWLSRQRMKILLNCCSLQIPCPAESVHVFHIQSQIYQQLNWNSRIPNCTRNCVSHTTHTHLTSMSN
jgi:hypothetical protein